jgi:hypothetical protein
MNQKIQEKKGEKREARKERGKGSLSQENRTHRKGKRAVRSGTQETAAQKREEI